MSNIVAPSRCIWLRPVKGDKLEIILLGEIDTDDITRPSDIAEVFVAVRWLVEHHPGWDRVDSIAMAGTLIGLRAHRGPNAKGPDVLAEAMRMFEGLRGVRWRSGGNDADERVGIVGEW